MNKKIKGFIYVISNCNFPNYYKIGVTKNIKNRLKVYQTGSPYGNYKIEHYIEHNDIYGAEKLLHDQLYYFALNRKKEWFEIDLNMLVSQLDDLAA